VIPNINSVEVHPQVSNNGHPVDDALVGAGSRWPVGPPRVKLPPKRNRRTPWGLNFQ